MKKHFKGIQTCDRRFKTRDSGLAYFVNQLENLDKRLYEPLVSISWSRDIKLRSGISMSDETTSFLQSTLAGAGTLQNTTGNMPWISPETTAIPGVSVDGKKVVQALRLLGREVSYTSVELERSSNTQQPIDVQKVNGLNLLYNMNIDQMVYIGSSDVGATGLANNANVTSAVAAAGLSGSTAWAGKTPDEMLADVNTALTNAWAASGYAVCPDSVIIPPSNFSLISSQKVSSAGNVSVLKFLKENSIALNINGKELNINPVKWLPGLGSGSTGRMVTYTNSEDRVRYPMVPIRRETPYYQGIRFAAPYIWMLGEMEFVYPETVYYTDGI
jgi:hypothetical protein